ncbi:hypothetical protein A3A39_00775 [Candidatus Kaiserbacteria bacterium RIFCSPLOWO2_01_FULL_54_13]|uniref:DUF218 domain-containing protein n=1 Tax=Candidatus Kaiserbacteria bacterium RIFCSPLOWO2_01_FULL_54_13 TaxID=1798512 RepID=A0A1F6EZV6_9BACT|nr:MAG: hypothetical protein A3A39_00775 [Candidatus Kaiserbacteria bacterium RIFCSPLOWO2_01_FULL_54_13]
MAFGIPATLWSNRCIAEAASWRALVLRGPVFTQIGIRMWDGIPTFQIPGESSTSWATTMQMAFGAVDWAQKNGIDELWIVAARSHLARALRDVRFAVRKAGASIEVRAAPEVGNFSDADWFRKESGQLRTRSRFFWLCYNTALFLVPMGIYLRIAGRPLRPAVT